MKTPHLILPLVAASLLGLPAMADEFEDGMRAAFTSYKKGDEADATAQLRKVLEFLEKRSSERAAGLLPDGVESWKGETVSFDDIPGGGKGMTRIYKDGAKSIKLMVVKGSPLVAQLVPILGNEELIKMTQRKTHQIAGETAIMEGEHKLQLILDERIYVEMEGDETTGETELVSFARKLDLPKLAKIH